MNFLSNSQLERGLQFLKNVSFNFPLGAFVVILFLGTCASSEEGANFATVQAVEAQKEIDSLGIKLQKANKILEEAKAMKPNVK